MAKPHCFLLIPFAVACAHRQPAPTAGTAANVAGETGSAAGAYACTQIMGVSVTGDWFGAGFEDGLDGGRWQAMWRKHAFVNLWADPANELWSQPLTSPCTAGAQNPDRVIFTGV